jgi:hypothetical protein
MGYSKTPTPVPPPKDHNGNLPIPQTVNAMYNNLPPVDHDQALKRAMIQFSGLGDIFAFYNQWINVMEQFGIYLVPLTNVKYQQSLCPTKIVV